MSTCPPDLDWMEDRQDLGWEGEQIDVNASVSMHFLSSNEQLTILKVENNSTLKKSGAASSDSNAASSETTSKTVERKVEEKNVEGDSPETGSSSPSRRKEKGGGVINETKVDYIVLHKLPNGEALDLENMQTYTMDDLETGMSLDGHWSILWDFYLITTTCL